MWGVGNGNFAGAISYRGLATQVNEGYAAVGTDAGHAADSMDASWALGHREKVIDFGHRAVHEAAANAKRLIAAFYGRLPKRAYFGSCSDGGREALMEAQRYPHDYDGIIAGAPAYAWTHLFIGGAVVQQWLLNESHRIPVELLAALQSAALQACDKLDGVRDGVIEDPRRCEVPRSALACQGPETARCLTPAQLATVQMLHDGPVLGSGKRLFRGYAPGSEGAWGQVNFASGEGPNQGLRYVNEFFRNFVFEDPQWDLRTFDPERDGRKTDERLAGILNAGNPDLSEFAARGGRLILYQGWNDPVIPPFLLIDYYNRVLETLGNGRARESVRLFMAPGMEHCLGGPGPNDFGQFSGGGGDPDTSMGAALQRWVERGVAPERIIAAKRENDADPSSEVVRTRPLCAYPGVARYRGAGSTDAAASFVCGTAGRQVSQLGLSAPLWLGARSDSDGSRISHH
jgi:feruloyl esterase